MDPRNFPFLSLDASLIGDVARQVHEEGHGVRYHVDAEGDRLLARGYLGP